MESKVITAHVPLPLAERIDELAARLQRSRGWIMKQALEAWADHAETGGMVHGFAEALGKFEHYGNADAAAARAAETGAAAAGGAAPGAGAAVAGLRALRETTTLGDISWRELRDAGRR
jgi:predicted transcriptional regulator